MNKLLLLFTIVLFTAAFSEENSSEGALKKADKFFEYLKLGVNNLIDSDFFDFNPKWGMKSNLDDIKKSLVFLNPENLGQYGGAELVKCIKVSDSLYTIIYIAKYERQPIFFKFSIYKFDSEWRLNNFFVDTNYESTFDKKWYSTP